MLDELSSTYEAPLLTEVGGFYANTQGVGGATTEWLGLPDFG